MKLIFAAIFAACVLASCSVGPNYEQPETPVPAEWPHADSTMYVTDSLQTLSDTTWWDLFQDTVLTNLVRSALEENVDVKIAAARVEQLMGQYGVDESQFWPKFDVGAGVDRGQYIAAPTNGDGVRVTANRFQVNLSAGWEIDLWGKVRRATEAAKADLLASEEARRGVVLSTVALIATSYFDLLSLDSQLEFTRRTAENRKNGLDLFKQRLEKGDLSELEYNQAESEYWFAMAEIPRLEKGVTFLEHTICVLLGRNPGPIPRGKVLDSLTVPEIPFGLASQVLERRPDVRLAEEQLRSANARVGVAKAQYFPSISLTGLLGMVSGDLNSLFAPESRVWSVGGSILAPIFRGGEISGQVETAQGVKKELLYNYVNTVHNAFRDAEDALVDRTKTWEQATAEEKRVTALSSYLRLANMRFSEGVTSYLEVLDADRNLYSSQVEYVQTKAEVYKSIVGVYRAFAGGWLDKASMESFQVVEPPERREKQE
jgi:multidrug efflux system outer membrane protein